MSLKCHRYRQWVLLKPSGELAFPELEELETHLAACPACRAYQDTAARLADAARAGRRQGEPSRQALEAIRRAALAELERPSWSRHRYVRVLRIVQWRSALSWAAAALIALTGGYLLGSYRHAAPGPTVALIQPDTPDAQVSREQLADLTETPEEPADWFWTDTISVESLPEAAQRSTISRLDRDLMMAEGLAI